MVEKEEQKKCQMCKKLKPLEEFSKTLRGTFGKVAYCKPCMKDYHKMYNSLPRNRKAQNARMRKYRQIHLELCRERDRKYQQKVRLRALQKIVDSTKVSCAHCGCDDFRYLEINHKNGGGAILDYRKRKPKGFYMDIISGVRGTDDLEVLCKPCNSLHALKLKYGFVPPYTIIWRGFAD